MTATYSRTAGETVGGPYTISATLSPAGVLGNYDITYNTAKFTITKATLTVTADNKTKLLNAANPPLPPATRLRQGELASGVTGRRLTTTAVTNSPVGTIRSPRHRDADGAQLHVRLRQWHPERALRLGRLLQPINDTAHDLETMSKFKLGQTVPAKFDLKDVNGVAVQSVSPSSTSR